MDELNIKEIKKGNELSIDENITPELKREGDFRELLRSVQDLRKKEGLMPNDLIVLTLTNSQKEIVIGFEDELKKNHITQPSIADISKAVINIRSSKLPDPKNLGNAGSFFKNPEIDEHQFLSLKSEHPGIIAYPSGTPGQMKLAAGWLIEQCGWKGKQLGQVGMHAQQALVLVKIGRASCRERV